MNVSRTAGHAVFGHTVRLAVDADAPALAVDRLAEFASIVAETDTLAAEAFASSLVLVTASFPEADLSAVAGGAAKRSALTVSSGTTAARAALGGGAFADEVTAWPNPASDRGTVRVSVSGPVSAVASVYDALGRRVAVLHDGPLAAGAHDFAFEASRLAPGVYVINVRVRPDTGAAWTEVRRITVAR